MHARWQLGRAVLREQRAVAEDLRVGEFTRFHFEPVVPVTAPETFQQITRDGHVARAPLADDVEVLMEQQGTIGEEFLAAAAQVDAVRARGGDGAPVKAHEDAVLDDLDLSDGFAEQGFERLLDVLWGVATVTEPHVTYLCRRSRRYGLTSRQ